MKRAQLAVDPQGEPYQAVTVQFGGLSVRCSSSKLRRVEPGDDTSQAPPPLDAKRKQALRKTVTEDRAPTELIVVPDEAVRPEAVEC